MTAHELRKMLSEMGLDAKVEFKKKALFPADAPGRAVDSIVRRRAFMGTPSL